MRFFTKKTRKEREAKVINDKYSPPIIIDDGPEIPVGRNGPLSYQNHPEKDDGDPGSSPMSHTKTGQKSDDEMIGMVIGDTTGSKTSQAIGRSNPPTDGPLSPSSGISRTQSTQLADGTNAFETVSNGHAISIFKPADSVGDMNESGNYYKSDELGKKPSIIGTNIKIFCWSMINAVCSALPRWVPYAVASGSVLAMVALLLVANNDVRKSDVKIALVGNFVLGAQDIPRLLEAFGNGHIQQNSCLHGSGSLSSILSTGNGMYNKWRTDNAIIGNDDYGFVYDYGACSVMQLLYGYDEDIRANDYNYAYYNDGRNPCFVSNSYLSYLQTAIKLEESNGFAFDPRNSLAMKDPHYVIMADQPKRIAVDREESLDAMEDNWSALLEGTNSTPILVETHAFWSQYSNMTGLDDIPTFQSLVHAGIQQYAYILQQGLPRNRKPIIAPVGLVFLAIWEDNIEMWNKLFFDGIHTSVHGSYVYGLVLYYTIYGTMPEKNVALPESLSNLWYRARRVDISSSGDDDDKYETTQSYPTIEEANYLFAMAEKVAKKGYRPKSLIKYDWMDDFVQYLANKHKQDDDYDDNDNDDGGVADVNDDGGSDNANDNGGYDDAVVQQNDDQESNDDYVTQSNDDDGSGGR